MMKGRSGVVLWDDTIRLGIEWRKKARAIRKEFEEREADPKRRWFFDPFVPDVVTGPDGTVTPWESVPTDLLAADAHYWELTPGAAWHGFTHVGPLGRDGAAPGFAITDPNKLTVLTPGFDRKTGAYADHGVPAPIVAQYLRENRIVPEKNDLNSLLFLLTPGVESSKAGTLISGLVAFKRFHDDNVLLEEAMPEFVRARPKRYRGVRLRDLCADYHAFHRESGTSALQRKQFMPEHLPEMVMPPKAAAQMLTRNKVDYVPIAEAEGRIATTLMLVYPPGIGTVLPGERLDARAKPMLDYFKMFEAASNLFPGFEAEIQGVYREVDPDGRIRFHTYVLREGA